MSADRGLRRLADWAGFTALWGWIVLSLLLVPGLFGYWWLGVAFALVGTVVCWEALKASTHPVTTIGTRREVQTEPIREAGYDCRVCDEPAGGGERRRYATHRVVFGSTVAVPEWGVNEYCSGCAGTTGESVRAPTEESACDRRDRERSLAVDGDRG
ncbi:hypothetical protein [Natrononativus amylolyticus]|uniref:hypothetical protein n=1 Tax=Natrononativus amylolyticus TaxID=2963434 RepID=UPI0020CDD5BC|nr:hypothetical protein [Natrononativus amylolyticus]